MKTCYFLFLVLVIMFVSVRCSAVGQQADDFWESYHASLSVHLTRYDTAFFNQVINRHYLSQDANDISTVFEKSEWHIRRKITPVAGRAGAYDLVYTFVCTSGQSLATAVSLDITFSRWSADNYVLMPAAVYSGNRVKSVHHPYVPFLFDAGDIGPDKPQVISDIPRLNIGKGPSRIQQRSGDMSTPGIGFHNPQTGQGFWLLTGQGTSLGDNGIDLEENNSRTKAVITLTAPVVREQYRYFIANMQYPSTDKPANFTAGDSVQFKARIYFFPSPNVQSLFNTFASIRNDLIPKGKSPSVIPFSAAFKILEEKFNRENFEPKFGYYSVGLRENCFQDWQIGWTGGMISTCPLLMAGNEQSREHVIRNFDWLFPSGISPSGYFWDTGEKGDRWFGIFPMIPQAKDLHLIRKSGDGLYYVLRQSGIFREQGIPVKPVWKQGARMVAEAFVRTWKTYGQLGQFVNNTTGEIVIGGSTSGAIVPAALVLASRYYANPEYKTVAEQIASYYYENFVSKGVTYGGPGDAMQNFDSESAYGMLESFMVLYEETGEKEWLSRAEAMAIQFASWVSSYDYRFPAGSTLGRLGKHTTGVVWANTQNKHGAPGICTHSGSALLRLYRATGNTFYLDLLRDITKAIPQYLCTMRNPIPGLEAGWISERVSTTDWLEGIGEIMTGSTWAETSLMLTATEIPGIYVDVARKLVCDFDQVEIREVKTGNDRLTITVENPTPYIAKISIFEDRSVNQKFSPGAFDRFVTLNPNEVKIITVSEKL